MCDKNNTDKPEKGADNGIVEQKCHIEDGRVSDYKNNDLHGNKAKP